jgi:regulator of protease activity HflC (stomatin/prohibitin superfamily)
VDVAVLLAALLVAFLVGASLQYFWPRPTIVREYERGLRLSKGRLVAEVGAGRYWLRPRVDEIRTVDTRRTQLVVAGQEVLTADRVPLKVSLLVDYAITDATKALIVVKQYRDALYGLLQIALREAVARKELDTALAERGELGDDILAAVAERSREFGVDLRSVSVRDFMLAGDLRSAYAEVILAKQQGLAALERARGESAALRNLANSAELLERHPGLAQLRLLQAIETGSDNRIVITLDPERGRKASVEVAAEET